MSIILPLAGAQSLCTLRTGGSRMLFSAQTKSVARCLYYCNLHSGKGNDVNLRSKSPVLMTRADEIQLCQQIIKRYTHPIVEGSGGTHKPTPFQKRILVMAKMYPSVDKVPERVTRTQLKNSMDRFRVKASIIMVALTFFLAAVMALIGRKERREGKSVSKMVLEKTGKP